MWVSSTNFRIDLQYYVAPQTSNIIRFLFIYYLSDTWNFGWIYIHGANHKKHCSFKHYLILKHIFIVTLFIDNTGIIHNIHARINFLTFDFSSQWRWDKSKPLSLAINYINGTRPHIWITLCSLTCFDKWSAWCHRAISPTPTSCIGSHGRPWKHPEVYRWHSC